MEYPSDSTVNSVDAVAELLQLLSELLLRRRRDRELPLVRRLREQDLSDFF